MIKAEGPKAFESMLESTMSCKRGSSRFQASLPASRKYASLLPQGKESKVGVPFLLGRRAASESVYCVRTCGTRVRESHTIPRCLVSHVCKVSFPYLLGDVQEAVEHQPCIDHCLLRKESSVTQNPRIGNL